MKTKQDDALVSATTDDHPDPDRRADNDADSPPVRERAPRATWPMHRRQWTALVISYIGLVAVWTGMGLLLKGPLDHTAIVRSDRRVARWFADHRTPNLNHYTVWGSDLADTFVKIAATAVLALVMLLIWRRWIEPLLLAVSLALEAATFITVTWIVGRPRPDVDRLEGSPVGSSFPSGHTAAAAAYSAIAVIVFWHTRKRWARWASVVISAMIPAVVGLSRMYRGMHFLTDVLTGVVLGVVSVAITVAILSHTPEGRAVARATDPDSGGVE